jgi:predicted Zn-dependent peptidase
MVLIILLLTVSQSSLASEYDPLGLYNVDYFKLSNGFDVVLKKRRGVRNVAVRLVVGAGFRHFPCEKRETPHFIEHLLFHRGSEHSDAEFQRRIENHGGRLKGFTRSTVTDYQVDIYDRHLPVAINTLHEIITRAVISPQIVESVRAIIYRERKGEYPWLVRWLYEKGLFKGAVVKAGEVLLPGTDVRCPGFTTPGGITEADVTDGYANYYVPGNMTLVVVGNFDRLEVLTQIKSTFGKLPPKIGNGTTLISPPHFAGTKEVTGILWPLVSSDGDVGIIYRTGGRSSSDFYALSILAKYLRYVVYERIRVKEAISYTPSAGYYAEEDFGFFMMFADVSLGKMDRAEALLKGGAHWVTQGQISADRLEAIKRGFIWELAVLHDSNSSLADYYVSNLSQLKTNGKFSNDAAFIARVTSEEIHDLANRILNDDARVIIRSTPTFTYTQFVVLLGILLTGVPGAGIYIIRQLLKNRQKRIQADAPTTPTLSRENYEGASAIKSQTE